MASSGGGPTEGGSCEDLERMIIDTDPEKFFQIVAQLPTLEKQALIEFLRDNVDIFAWESLFLCTILSNSSLSHTLPLHDSHLNTWLLIAKIQADLAQNKANKMVD